MDQYSYYQPFNHYLNYLQYPQYPPSPAPAPVPDLPLPYYDTPTPAPGSPSDFIYNSSANATAIFRPFRSSHPSIPNGSASTTTLSYPQAMGYGPSRPVEQSFPAYLPRPSLPESSLPEPTPGLAEHRRQRQSGMSMGPGPSKSVPPPLALGGNRGGDRGSDSGESIVVIKQEEGSPSPVLVSMPMVKKVKKWEPRMPTEGPGQQIKVDGKERLFDPFGSTPGMEMGNENRMGSEIGSGSGSGTWEERGEGVMERVMPPIVPSIGMGMDMGTEMEPTIMPKMGLFKPIRWDGPSSSFSASRSSRSSRVKARCARRAWEASEKDGGDVHLQRTYGTQNQNENGSRNRNRNNNEETEDEQPINAPISSSSHPRSSKRLKTSPSGFAFRSASASASAETETETETATVKIKQEPGLSPSPSAIFAQIPMYSHPSTNNSGYETAGHDGNPPSSRSISPLTRVPTPRRLLFPTSNRSSTGTGTNSQLSLRGVSKQLKKRNWVMGLDREEGREESRGLSQERSRERRGEGFWSLARGGGGGSQAQGRNTTAAQDEEEIGEWASPRQQQQQQQQQQYRGSSEEKEEEGWTTISGSSEEGEVSSHYENSYSYSCGQERDDDGAPGNTHQSSPFIPYGDQEWCHPFSSSSASASRAPVPGSSSPARYGPGSAPSLSASQEREEQYRQAIQMVQDTCLEASKRYIRAHCVNRGARGGDNPNTHISSVSETRSASARKARRKRKLETRHAFCSSSIFSSSSPSPPPSRRRRKNRKRTTTTPPSSSSSPHPQLHSEIPCTDSLLPNISQICTLLWSRSQSLRLHDTDSIELHTARNMYWLLSWAETVAFAVPPPTPTASIPDPDSTTSGRTSVGSSFTGFGVSSLENLAASGRGQWNRPSSSAFSRRYRDRYRDRDLDRDGGVEHAISPWENFGEELNEEGYMWRRRNSEEGLGGFEMLESRNGAVWEQQWGEMKRVFDEGGMLCEFLGYGEGVERIARVREFYGF